jgi:enoyl-CoA hydratase/carnithine racemase
VASYYDILYEVDDPVATITFNRPERLNALTPAMAAELRDAIGRAERDEAVVGIVITGAGRGFCAGADLAVLDAVISGEQQDDVGGLSPIDRRRDVGDPSWGEDLNGGTYTYLLSVPKPIIAAINGPVVGMAVPLVLACDLRFMADDAILTTAFAHRGLIAEWGLSWLLPRLVGPAVALDLLYSARKVGAEECERLGLVNRRLPTADLLPFAHDYVVDLARSSSPASLAVMKRQVYQQLHAGLGPAEREAKRLMVESFGRPDFAEGVKAFQERRPPSFPRLAR